MDKEKLIDLIDKSYSFKMLAKEFGCAVSTISYWLNKYNLKTNVTIRNGKRCGKKFHAIWYIEIEKIQEALNTCGSYLEICNLLNIDYTKCDIRALCRRIKKDCIDACQFKIKIKEQNKNRLRQPPVGYKRNLEDILIQNSTYLSTNNLKQKLLKNNKMKYECQNCKISEWDGKKLVLQLDHINGVSNDHRFENLRLLCPNCHSQTETFAGKGFLIKHECFTCTNLIRKGLKYCPDCKKSKVKKIETSINRRKQDRPSYEILLEEIKNSNFVQVGKKYGVSDNAIRKWVKFYKENN